MVQVKSTSAALTAVQDALARWSVADIAEKNWQSFVHNTVAFWTEEKTTQGLFQAAKSEIKISLGLSLTDNECIELLDFLHSELSLIEKDNSSKEALPKLTLEVGLPASKIKPVTVAKDSSRNAANENTPQTPAMPTLPVRHIVAISSAKGGVGKSTVTANLALALAARGLRVGIVDADIYGPSQPALFGVPENTKPKITERKTSLPINVLGIELNSIGLLVGESTPMIWRGPMATQALQQLIFQTEWSALDILLIDMPPGTGDIALTLSQRVPLNGAVVVTTPQDIAILDAQKGIEMFGKVHIPVLGVIENMSNYCCPNCGYEDAIFGSEGAQRLAAHYDLPIFAQIPLARVIQDQTQAGVPLFASHPDLPMSQHYRSAARALELALWQHKIAAIHVPEIEFVED
ncbi:MAG: Mrp/NBP35 family ATP-binding protein [Pseudomonadota bacterium]